MKYQANRATRPLLISPLARDRTLIIIGELPTVQDPKLGVKEVRGKVENRS